jgi:hypothetical protein
VIALTKFYDLKRFFVRVSKIEHVWNYLSQEGISEGKKRLFLEWAVGDGVSLGPNQEQHRDYLDCASAAHGGGADACCRQFPGDGRRRRTAFMFFEGSTISSIHAVGRLVARSLMGTSHPSSASSSTSATGLSRQSTNH